MLDFTYKNTTEIIFGQDIEEKIGDLARGYGRRVLLHYGGGSIQASGLYERLVAQLEGAGCQVFSLGGVVPNPRVSLVREGIDLCRTEDIDLVFAVGGGSVIDSAKAISFGRYLEEDVWQAFLGKVCPDKRLPLICLLTLPAAGSESSSHSVITNEEGWVKLGMGADCLRPDVALMNPLYSLTLPDYQTACGASDMLAHVMERYFSHTEDITFTDGLCEASMRSIIDLSKKVLSDPQAVGPRSELMWAGTVAHNGYLDQGRLTDWASHGIEHELSAIYDIAHGAGLSIIFPAWMRYVKKEKKNQAKLLDFGRRVMGIEASGLSPEAEIEEGILALEDYYKEIGMPTRLVEVSIGQDRFKEMALKATGQSSFKLGNFQFLDAADIENIYRLAYQ